MIDPDVKKALDMKYALGEISEEEYKKKILVLKENGLEEESTSETNYCKAMFLVDPGHNKLNVIKIIKNYLEISLEKAKEIVDKYPSLVLSQYDEIRDLKIKQELEEVGAKTKIVYEENKAENEKTKKDSSQKHRQNRKEVGREILLYKGAELTKSLRKMGFCWSFSYNKCFRILTKNGFVVKEAIEGKSCGLLKETSTFDILKNKVHSLIATGNPNTFDKDYKFSGKLVATKENIVITLIFGGFGLRYSDGTLKEINILN